MIAIGVSTTPIFVRLTRGQVMNVKVEDYVEAARAMGNPRWRIAVFHILPNIMPALLVQATLSIAAAIIAEAALSFLGLGQQPPAPSWGSMLNAAQRFLTNAPWMALWPDWRSSWWCCRSTWSATACATRSIRGSGRCQTVIASQRVAMTSQITVSRITLRQSISNSRSITGGRA